MQVRAIRASEIEAARLLLQANGWGQRVADPATFAELVKRSQVALVAVQGGRVVGAALVRRAVGDKPEMTWVLRAGNSGVSGFYERLGFRPSEVAMERPGRRD